MAPVTLIFKPQSPLRCRWNQNETLLTMKKENYSHGISKSQHSRLNVSVYLKGNIYGH